VKTLFLLRHAKSSWEDSNLADFDRPLNSRGLKAARFIGELMFERGLAPQAIFSSPAKRAKQTAVLVREIGELPAIVFEERIYEASPMSLLNIIAGFDPSLNSVLIVGHNPGVEGLVRVLTGETHSIPTAALSMITLGVENWSDVASNCGTLNFVIRPKDFLPL
jgi:phosphohistidine phosphatase